MLEHVHQEIRTEVAKDAIATDIVASLEGMFTIQGYRRFARHNGHYTSLFCKPSKSLGAALALDNREVVVLIARYRQIDPRAVKVIEELMDERGAQLSRRIAMVVHEDSDGDDQLRAWGRERGMVILPVLRAAGAVPSRALLRQRLAQELFSTDPFQVSGPVADDPDFFGRGGDALALLRQLESGRIRSLFGIRKMGKTSMINRVVRLARESGTVRIAMIDCSVKNFNALRAQEALRVLTHVARAAMTRGYAHAAELTTRTGLELEALWAQPNSSPIAIIFDEIDYITPGSPAPEHWATEFNDFWREFRAYVQEAHRNGLKLGVLVAGVSSAPFRSGQIAGRENAALHFVPEEYLGPFAREASDPMIKDLGNRCGLVFSKAARARIAEIGGDVPFWIRMAGSFLHRSIAVDGRPRSAGIEVVESLLSAFVDAEGAEIAAVALGHLRVVFPDMIEALRDIIGGRRVQAAAASALIRYGLVKGSGHDLRPASPMIVHALERMEHAAVPSAGGLDSDASTQSKPLALSTTEWAEELAVLNRRRNVVERGLRDFTRFALKADPKVGSKWLTRVLEGLPEKRREQLGSINLAFDHGEPVLERARAHHRAGMAHIRARIR